MKNIDLSTLLIALGIALPATVMASEPCEIAKSELEFSYSYLSPKSVQALKECAAKNPICVLNYEDKLVAGQSVKDIAKEPSGAVFGLYQPDANTCLVGQFSGGSAAAWLFEGWRTGSGKPVPIKNFSKIRLNSDSVFPIGLIQVMDSGMSRPKTTKPQH